MIQQLIMEFDGNKTGMLVDGDWFQKGTSRGFYGMETGMNLVPLDLLDTSQAVLCVIDMQNDFTIGSFAINNNLSGLDALVQVLQREWKCVAASKDFHPCNHMSFNTSQILNADGEAMLDERGRVRSGPFPPHCVQDEFKQKQYTPEALNREIEAIKNAEKSGIIGYRPDARGGAKFDKRVLAALKTQPNVHVFFKALFRHVDSFGASAYTKDTMNNRQGMLTHGRLVEELDFVTESDTDQTKLHDAPTCINAFTGSWKLDLSDPYDIDSDPKFDEKYKLPLDSACVRTHELQNISGDYDAEAVFEDMQRLDEFIKTQVEKHQYSNDGALQVFVCGLALDFCVQDTAVNLKARFGDQVDVFVIMDASTPVMHYDPKKLTDEGVKLATERGFDNFDNWPKKCHGRSNNTR